jgi:hypothetical protein
MGYLPGGAEAREGWARLGPSDNGSPHRYAGPYSLVAALEPGRTSWTLPLDAVRLGPSDDATEVTATQVREVVARLIEAGHWRDGDPGILVVFDSGYDLTRLTWLLAGLPAEIMGRLRSDRVMYFPAPPRPARPAGTGGRPPRHGAALKLSDPQTWPAPAVTTSTQTTRYGTARRWPGAGCTSNWPAVAAGRARRPAASHRGHPHPASGRSPARRPQPRTAVALVITRRHLRRRGGPHLAGVPAQVRS